VAGKSYKIMMILWQGCEESCRGFRDYLKSRDIPVQYKLKATHGPEEVAELVDQIELAKTSLVVTTGPQVTLALVGPYDRVNPNGHLTDTPVLFMMVPDPVGSRIVPNLESSGRNVSGTLADVPEDAQIQIWQAYRPVQKLGMLVNPASPDSVRRHQRFQEAANKLGFTLLSREVRIDAEGVPISAGIRAFVRELANEGAQYLYLGSDPFLQSQRDNITDEGLQHRLPVVSSIPQAVSTSQALLSVVARPYDVGWLTARRAEEILVSGANPSDIPIRGLERFSVLVNMHVADQLDMTPNMDLLRAAEVIPAGD
jgi:putative ABC transport system substrate-binding protein